MLTAIYGDTGHDANEQRDQIRERLRQRSRKYLGASRVLAHSSLSGSSVCEYEICSLSVWF